MKKSLPTDDVEVKAGIAWVTGYWQKYRLKSNNREQLLHDLKEAIRRHNTAAQCYLGMLYTLVPGELNTFLGHNPEKAKFWLQRAADRGDLYAKAKLMVYP